AVLPVGAGANIGHRGQHHAARTAKVVAHHTHVYAVEAAKQCSGGAAHDPDLRLGRRLIGIEQVVQIVGAVDGVGTAGTGLEIVLGGTRIPDAKLLGGGEDNRNDDGAGRGGRDRNRRERVRRRVELGQIYAIATDTGIALAFDI